MTTFLIDTGPLVAFFNRHDHFHEWAGTIFEMLPESVYTTEPVLTEAVYFLKKWKADYAELLNLVENGTLQIDFQLSDSVSVLRALMAKYHPRMDLADASLVAAAQAVGDCQVVTIDREDFQTYRLLDRKKLDIVAPPG